jgi:hypothetical protein
MPVSGSIAVSTGIAYGIGGFGEHIRLTAGWLAVEAAGLAAMVAGVILWGSRSRAASPTCRDMALASTA